ncbi:NAD(+) diphosphatase [Anaeromicropila populeti]|uniref:NAD(+) diphosphatase n=1 Tax=Anaeromicropila populeti TaxID=37658 RepID=A0A1I6JVI4_9FIRM|nr:NAD(+) diphosphatase [Anaeromicropila populeti]SFR83004.1 NAD+ diphosphatase [Anaeromicropila populeti]
MIQEIGLHKFNNNFAIRKPDKKDYLLFYKENTVLLKRNGEQMDLPRFQEVELYDGDIYENSTYLFSIDEEAFFLVSQLKMEDAVSFEMQELNCFRTFEPMWKGFAGITGSQLFRWYEGHQFCGRCGKPMVKSQKERALLCENCGRIDFPKISPAVIVGVTDKDKILLSKYSRGNYKNYALLAGFTEVGETLEETVQREVMEEVGLKVKNIRYYKNQPWSFSDSLLVGFFAELDGSSEITLDKEELASAEWFGRDEMPEIHSNISLTGEMMEWFRSQKTE